MNDVAIIVAAGASRRLGQPKQLVVVNGETLLQRTVRICREAGLEPAVVVAPHFDGDLGGARRLDNPRAQEGMGTSVAVGATWADNVGADSATVVPCDLPLLQPKDLAELVETRRRADLDVSAAELERGVIGAPACFSPRLFARLQGLSGDRGAGALLRSGQLTLRSIPMSAAATDIDTPEDLTMLQRLHLLVPTLGAGLLCLLLAPPVSAQDDPPVVVGPTSAWYMLAGVTGGSSNDDERNSSGFIGGELSLTELRRGVWSGFFADGVWDFREDKTVVSAGPQLGYGIYGLDGGIGARIDSDDIELGPQVRLVFAVGILSIFVRSHYWPDGGSGEFTGLVGASFKLPLITPAGIGPAER